MFEAKKNTLQKKKIHIKMLVVLLIQNEPRNCVKYEYVFSMLSGF